MRLNWWSRRRRPPNPLQNVSLERVVGPVVQLQGSEDEIKGRLSFFSLSLGVQRRGSAVGGGGAFFFFAQRALELCQRLSHLTGSECRVINKGAALIGWRVVNKCNDPLSAQWMWNNAPHQNHNPFFNSSWALTMSKVACASEQNCCEYDFFFLTWILNIFSLGFLSVVVCL